MITHRGQRLHLRIRAMGEGCWRGLSVWDLVLDMGRARPTVGVSWSSYVDQSVVHMFGVETAPQPDPLPRGIAG